LSADIHHESIEVVLVRPRNPLNIGAAARAMANFGFNRLTVVAPFEAHWREARSAVGAPELLAAARETETLAEAVRDCTLVAGTGSLERRKPEQQVVKLPDLPTLAGGEIARGGRVAIVFGPEKHGLTREDLSLCHVLVEIPTDERQPSMNLGQAVAVCLYELAAHGSRTEGLSDSESTGQPGAPSGTLDLLTGVIEETMVGSGYSPAIMRGANRLDLRMLLRRLRFNEPDARRALRLFRRILWRMRQAEQISGHGGAPE
jgi:TrmH family RNA methyltransferase